jgi:phosphohistidine swiveling domain-containing protein
MKLLYPLTTDERPVLGEVGGKAASLMCMIQRGFPVPPGFVLALAFFEPWLEHICRTPEWASVLNSSPEEMAQRCEAVKALGLDLEMDPAREGMLAQALEPLTVGNSFPLLAVRSSSPEEDLEDLSFAGGYETTLGVTPGRLKEAIRRSFASCLDARVLVYKQQHGLSIHRPRIAVIVQQQVAAETAGVAFSLNPINNCYDEAVINANFGLGESVVSGQVSPDSFVVDKVSRAILRRKLGKKETSTWLQPDGSLALKPSPSRAALCLSDAQVLELAEMLVGVEDAYERPVDIEWAFAAGRPYLLQARPITAYVPLPEDMQTRPGEPRVLYIDYTLAKQGIDFPLSTMGADCWERVQRSTLGADGLFGLENGLMFTRGGRFYANLSRYLKLQSKESTASQIRLQDTLSADTIRNLDDVYKADRLPGSLKAALVRMALARIATVVGALRALSRPQQRHQVLLEESQRLERDLAAEQAKEQSIGALARATIRRVADYQNKVSLPATVAAELARSRINRLLSGEEPGVRAKVIYLQRGLPNNVTVEMGLAMYELASFDEVRACPSAAEFTRRIDQRTFSAEFLRAWDVFTETYGHRSAVDLDMAAPRFREVPGEVYRQLQTMAVGIDTERVEDARNSLAVYERGIVERTQAYEFLLEIVRRRSKRQAKRFAKYYSVLVTFEGYREIHKYYIVWVVDILRQKALAVGQSLVQAGRLDSVVQVFDLTIEELDRGQADPSLDLRALANENTRFLSKSRHVRHYPRIIDSRGKIVLPPRKEAKAGELLGEPISPGTVRGKVKVLAMPDEKPVLPGEILVTRATDPGWTPLFLNAAGIILEVGGVLQHGAVVAREYGKPCVIGIQDAATILRDGQVVELDGANGIVRLV